MIEDKRQCYCLCCGERVPELDPGVRGVWLPVWQNVKTHAVYHDRRSAGTEANYIGFASTIVHQCSCRQGHVLRENFTFETLEDRFLACAKQVDREEDSS